MLCSYRSYMSQFQVYQHASTHWRTSVHTHNPIENVSYASLNIHSLAAIGLWYYVMKNVFSPKGDPVVIIIPMLFKGTSSKNLNWDSFSLLAVCSYKVRNQAKCSQYLMSKSSHSCPQRTNSLVRKYNTIVKLEHFVANIKFHISYVHLPEPMVASSDLWRV